MDDSRTSRKSFFELSKKPCNAWHNRAGGTPVTITQSHVARSVLMSLLGGEKRELMMGSQYSSHIKAFLISKTIENVTTDQYGWMTLHFTDGESIRLAHTAKYPKAKPDVEVIATPFRSDGTVKQTTEIISDVETREATST